MLNLAWAHIWDISYQSALRIWVAGFNILEALFFSNWIKIVRKAIISRWYAVYDTICFYENNLIKRFKSKTLDVRPKDVNQVTYPNVQRFIVLSLIFRGRICGIAACLCQFCPLFKRGVFLRRDVRPWNWANRSNVDQNLKSCMTFL